MCRVMLHTLFFIGQFEIGFFQLRGQKRIACDAAAQIKCFQNHIVISQWETFDNCIVADSCQTHYIVVIWWCVPHRINNMRYVFQLEFNWPFHKNKYFQKDAVR